MSSKNIHPTAIVDPNAKLGENVKIGAYSIIGPEVTIGNGTVVESHVVIEGETIIGENNYIFSENVTTKQVIRTILDEFLKKFPPEKYPDKKKFYDDLKLASIVEAEVPDEADKPKVAGIFLKRLEIGMKLESDATLKYELGRQATRNDLKLQNTAYNSYKVKGLPPTPIGNPPIETFKAVLNAEKTDDLFFFTYKGKTYYSKTHEEHLKKRRESGQLK